MISGFIVGFVVTLVVAYRLRHQPQDRGMLRFEKGRYWRDGEVAYFQTDGPACPKCRRGINGPSRACPFCGQIA